MRNAMLGLAALLAAATAASSARAESLPIEPTPAQAENLSIEPFSARADGRLVESTSAGEEHLRIQQGIVQPVYWNGDYCGPRCQELRWRERERWEARRHAWQHRRWEERRYGYQPYPRY